MSNTIRIDGDGTLGNTRVFVEDKDVSGYVRSVALHIGINNPVPIVTIEAVGRVNLPDELKARLVVFGGNIGPCPHQIAGADGPVCYCNAELRQGCEWQDKGFSRYEEG